MRSSGCEPRDNCKGNRVEVVVVIIIVVVVVVGALPPSNYVG